MKSILIAPVMSLALFTAGCLSSPLLHHADADQGSNQVHNLASSGCALSFPNAGLCASMQWTQTPSDDEGGQFILRFWSATQGTENGPFIDPGQAVGIKIWMPSMGHGSSPVRLAAGVDASGAVIPGVFQGTEAYFMMHGEWEIWVQLKQGRQVLEQAKIIYQY